MSVLTQPALQTSPNQRVALTALQSSKTPGLEKYTYHGMLHVNFPNQDACRPHSGGMGKADRFSTARIPQIQSRKQEGTVRPGCSRTAVIPSPSRSIERDFVTARPHRSTHQRIANTGRSATSWLQHKARRAKKVCMESKGAARACIQCCFRGSVCI